MTAGEGSGSAVDDSAADKPPLYARVLRLNHIRPGPWWCFLFFEGALAVAGVLVLADWVSPWGLLVLPVGVALAVKLNDVVTGALPPAAATKARGKTSTDKSSGSEGKSGSGGKSTAAKATSDGATSTADKGEEPAISEGQSTSHRAVAGETGPDPTAEIKTTEGRTTDNSTADDPTTNDLRWRTSEPAAAEAGISLSDNRTAQDKAAEEKFAAEAKAAEAKPAGDEAADNHSRGKSDSGVRGRRGALGRASVRSRRIAGGKTTAPTRSGSTPAKDER